MKSIGTGTFKATRLMRDLVNQVLDTGQISYGSLSLRFEQEFAKWHDTQYAILSNSGTSALHVALQALKEVHHWERGQVIVPATTFVATPNVVVHNGLVPVFVDVDPRTYNIDVTKIEEAITSDTKAILPVHLFGQPANMTAIMEIANRYRLKVVEDSCETMFVHHRGKSVGSIGDIGCFSMYVAHLLVTGVGGMSTSNHPEYAAKMRSLVNHGMMIEHLNPGENFSPRPMPGRRFKFDTRGHSFRITELEAAIGLAQLDKKEVRSMLDKRVGNALHLTTRLTNFNEHYSPMFQLPFVEDGNEHAYMMYPIVLIGKAAGRKEELMAYLNKYGITTRDMLPLINQPAYRWLTPRDYPVSANLVENGLYVGCHQDLDMEDIGYIADVLGLWGDENFQAIRASRMTNT